MIAAQDEGTAESVDELFASPGDAVPVTSVPHRPGGTVDHLLSRPWQIGPVRIHGRAVLAPMAGLTDGGMRSIAEGFGAAFTVSEMVAASPLARGEAEHRIRADRAGVNTHVIQIAGCRGADMAEAARLAEASGAAWVDINMGCPSKRVTGGEAGSALMRDLPHAVALIRATVAATTLPVTVKMRLGWDVASRNAAELARAAEGEGVAAVTVHARTRCQFYNGRADWAAVRDVTRAVRVPVIVNGDCASIADARRMLALSGATAVMVGRAAVGRPWLVGDIAVALTTGRPRPPIPIEARRAAAQQHYRSLLATFGPEKGLRHARKHLAAYAFHTGASETLRARLVRSDDPAEVLAMLSDVFDPTTVHDGARAA